MRSKIVWQAAVGIVIALAMDTTSRAGTRHEDASGRLFLRTAVERIYLSAQLADIGCEQNDPIPLLAAARLLAWASPSPAPLSPEITGGVPDIDHARPRVCVPFGPAVTERTSQSLSAEARALAGNDQQLLNVIDAARARNDEKIARSGNSGPDAYKLRLRRGAKATFHIAFNGQETASVAIVGTSGANLELAVLDEKNDVVCRGRARADYQLCSWTPVAKADFSVVVDNRGEWANEFTIYTN